jgi:hypothetical protein
VTIVIAAQTTFRYQSVESEDGSVFVADCPFYYALVFTPI